MNIDVPTPEEFQQEKRRKRMHFWGGIITGIIFLGLEGWRVFLWGFDTVTIYTWIALGFGVLSFGFLARWFGQEFWDRLSGR